MNMDVVKENQLSIPTYEKPAMVVMELEIEGGVLVGSADYNLSLGGEGGSDNGGTDVGDNGGLFDGGWGDMN